MDIKFADVPDDLPSIPKVHSAGWTQILAYMAFCEVSQDQSPGTAGSKADFGFTLAAATWRWS